MAIVEISSKKYKSGKRPFKAILYEIQPPECVVDDVGTKYNQNGITFLEKYCSPQLDSIENMSVTACFIDDEKTMYSDHGDTGERDGIAVFDDATILGHFTKGYITDYEIDGVKKRVCMGEGYLDEMRNHDFIKELEIALNNGVSPEGSIELYRSENNERIVYKKGWLPEGRIPTEFIHSGWSIVLNPSDSTSKLVELNTANNIKKKNESEEFTMDEKMMSQFVDSVTTSVKTAISETNSKNAEYEAKITEMNTAVSEKDNTISELNEKITAETTRADKAEATVSELNSTVEELNSKIATLEAELAVCKKEKKVSELNSALAGFTDEQKDFAKAEIETFNADPVTSEINTVVDKIYAGIGKQKIEAEKAEVQKISELNSVEKADDIYGEIIETNSVNEEISIY